MLWLHQAALPPLQAFPARTLWTRTFPLDTMVMSCRRPEPNRELYSLFLHTLEAQGLSGSCKEPSANEDPANTLPSSSSAPLLVESFFIKRTSIIGPGNLPVRPVFTPYFPFMICDPLFLKCLDEIIDLFCADFLGFFRIGVDECGRSGFR